MQRNPNELRPHPINAEIYGDSFDSELVQSIARMNILTPLIITGEDAEIGPDIVISGHRRLAVAMEYEMEEVPVVVSHLTDEMDIEEAIIYANRQRKKTTEQLAREYGKLKAIEEERARERQRQAAIDMHKARVNVGENIADEDADDLELNNHKVVNDFMLVENFPQASIDRYPAPKARDIAAEKLGAGISGKSLEHASRVVDVIDDYEESGKHEEAEQLREKLNKSVNGAYNQAKDHIAAKREFEEQPKKESAKKTFNATNDNIEWAKWSWNPVTGCKHGCPYCYARDIAMRFYGNFEPTFYEERLDAPMHTKIPVSRENEPGINNVFVCSMADLFGKFIDKEWIDRVFDSVRESPQWNYLFLTKFPKRYLEFEYTKQCWLGASADTQRRADVALETFEKLGDKGQFTNFLSCEPLLEPIVLGERAPMIDWIIIGGQSKTTGAPEFQPQWVWVENLLYEAREAGIKVYFKPNLKVRPAEYPTQDR